MQPSRLERLFEMLKDEPNDSFLKYAIATEYVKQNDMSKALYYYLDLIKSDEDYVGTYYHLAKLYERTGEKGKAMDIYTKGMQVARKLGDSHAFSELQVACNSLKGLEYEDD